MRLLISLFLLAGLYAGDLSVEQLFNVKTTEVKKIEYSPFKTFYGVSEADESGISDIVLRTDGYIGDIKVDRQYSYVKKGDELFTLYSPQIYTAASELLNTLGTEHEKLKESVITKLSLLGVDGKVIKELIATKKIKENIPFYSPAEGFVTEKRVFKGSGAKAGQLLFKITDYKKMWVIAKVYESDLELVKKGMRAKIRFDGDAKEYDSEVDFIYPAVDKKEKSVNVRLVLDNEKLRIYPGSFANVTIYSKSKTLLMLPKSAVITKGDNHYVFVAGEYEGEYEPRKIEAKRLDSGSFEIVSGLNEGESVVDNALFLFDSDAQLNGLY